MLPRALTDFARDAVAPIRARKLRREAEEELVDHMAEIYAQDLATGMSEEDAAGVLHGHPQLIGPLAEVLVSVSTVSEPVSVSETDRGALVHEGPGAARASIGSAD